MRLRLRLRSPVVLLAAAAAMCPARPSLAQIVTDRPDFVESSVTVGRGALQIETSLAYEATGSPPARAASWSTPTLLRLGLGPSLEVRLESDLLVRDASSPELAGEDGLADVALGLKWHARDARNGLPSTALLLHADLPSGSRTLRGAGVTPSLRLAAEWALPAGFSAGLMPGVRLSPTGAGRHVEGILGVVVGAALTPSLRAFGELAFDRLAPARHAGSDGTWDTGIAWLVTDRLQLDAALSVGATRAAPDVGVTFGVSHLLAPPRRSP